MKLPISLNISHSKPINVLASFGVVTLASAVVAYTNNAISFPEALGIGSGTFVGLETTAGVAAHVITKTPLNRKEDNKIIKTEIALLKQKHGDNLKHMTVSAESNFGRATIRLAKKGFITAALIAGAGVAGGLFGYKTVKNEILKDHDKAKVELPSSVPSTHKKLQLIT